VLRIDACRARVEEALDTDTRSGLDHVDVDERRAAHDLRVVLAGEDVSRSSHVGRELIDMRERAVARPLDE
jgi:hypothetical protein